MKHKEYLELLKIVKELIDEHYCILLHWDSEDNLCLLHKHWMYEYPLRNAPRVYLGNFTFLEKIPMHSPGVFWNVKVPRDSTLYIYSVKHFKEMFRKYYGKKIKFKN